MVQDRQVYYKFFLPRFKDRYNFFHIDHVKCNFLSCCTNFVSSFAATIPLSLRWAGVRESDYKHLESGLVKQITHPSHPSQYLPLLSHLSLISLHLNNFQIQHHFLHVLDSHCMVKIPLLKIFVLGSDEFQF